MGRVNINIHRLKDVREFIDIILPHLSSKAERAKLVRDFVYWKSLSRTALNLGNPDTQDDEYEFWNLYRRMYAGRGKKNRSSRGERDLSESVMDNSVPIHF